MKSAQISLAVASALLLGTSSLLADETLACKGSSQENCQKSAQCSWVASYERANGKQVTGYCRTKTARRLDIVQVMPQQKEAKQ